jgi:hypothetical protein
MRAGSAGVELRCVTGQAQAEGFLAVIPQADGLNGVCVAAPSIVRNDHGLLCWYWRPCFPPSAQPSEALHFDLMFLERIPDLAGCQAQQACGFGLNPAGFLHGPDQCVLAKVR